MKYPSERKAITILDPRYGWFFILIALAAAAIPYRIGRSCQFPRRENAMAVRKRRPLLPILERFHA